MTGKDSRQVSTNISPISNRRGAFSLTDYLLYTAAVYSSFYELAVGSAKNYWATPEASISSFKGFDEASVYFLTSSWALFVLVVFYRNYAVMYSIDQKRYASNYSRHLFFASNTRWIDWLERLLRLVIVVFVIISAKGIYGEVSFGEHSLLNFIWLPNYIAEFSSILSANFTNQNELFSESASGDDFKAIFIYYVFVLFFLFLVFVVYDFLLVKSTFLRHDKKWKKLNDNSSSRAKVVEFLRKNKDVDQLFQYLCYLEPDGTDEKGRPEYSFNRKKTKSSLFRWLSNGSAFSTYVNSIKFWERLAGILVCGSSILFLALPATLPGFFFSMVFLIIYLLCLTRNQNWFSTYRNMLRLKPLTDYFLTWNTHGKENYNLKKWSPFTENTMNILRKPKISIILIAAFFIAIFYAAYKTSKPDVSALNDQKDTIIVWQTESDKKAGLVLQEIEIDFERKFPNTDLQIETVGWGDLSKRLGIAIKQGNFPNVSHLQPFMVYSLRDKNLLLPITDLVTSLEAEYGEILPAVKNLQKYDSDYYGLAYAVGSTFWLVRSDMLNPNIDQEAITSWEDYLNAMSTSIEDDFSPKITLPGGSPFFIHQLYGELLANTGGKFFNPESLEPTLNTEENIKVLSFFRSLGNQNLLSSDWANTSYTDQFSLIAKGKILSAPVTYSRAARTIQVNLEKGESNLLNTDTFKWLPLPVPGGISNVQQGISTIDAEPYVIFKEDSQKKSKDGLSYRELSLEYLKMFYSPIYYERFTQAVPVQLTPIFSEMTRSQKYLDSVGVWMDWHNRTMDALSNEELTRPIMMPDISEAGRKIPFLLEFEASKILSNAVSKAINSDQELAEIANEMQEETVKWKRRFN